VTRDCLCKSGDRRDKRAAMIRRGRGYRRSYKRFAPSTASRLLRRSGDRRDKRAAVIRRRRGYRRSYEKTSNHSVQKKTAPQSRCRFFSCRHRERRSARIAPITQTD
jgi:hypothetical protein